MEMLRKDAVARSKAAILGIPADGPAGHEASICGASGRRFTLSPDADVGGRHVNLDGHRHEREYAEVQLE